MGEKEDWKNFLPDEARQVLMELLAATQKYRGAYVQAENSPVAHLWTALIDMKKDIDWMKDIIGRLEEPWKAIVSVGEAEKKHAIERLVAEIVKPTDQETQDATKKLVESLMKF
jgi:hypothetical protein